MRALGVPGVSFPRPALAAVRVRVGALPLFLGALTLAGLALRLLWVFYTDTIPLGGDPRWYYVVGINVAKGFGVVTARDEFLLEAPGPGYVTAFWPPGYAFFLGGLFKVFGVSITSAKVANALLGAAAVPAVFLLARRLFDARVALTAAALLALLPNAIVWAPLLFPEQLFTLMFVGALLIVVAFPLGVRHDWVPVAAFGIVLGLAMLTRGQAAVLLPVAALFWLAASGWRPAARATAVALIAMSVTIAPWTVRNAIQMDDFIPISTNSGAALRAGHAPGAEGTTKWPEDNIDGFYMWQSLYRPDWEVRGYREYTRRAIDYALSHPVREVQLSGLKVYHLHRSDSDIVPWLTTLDATPIEPPALEDALGRILDYSYYALFFGALASVPLWLRRDPRQWLLINTFVIYTAFHVVFLSEPRYHVPLYPILAIAFAAGLWTALHFLARRARRWRRTEATP